MSATKREGVSYIDGIPVKISEKFRPPRKVILPLNFQNRFNMELFNMEYDFSLENQVIKQIEDAKALEAEILEAEAQAECEEEQENSDQPANETPTDCASALNNGPKQMTCISVASTMNGGEILKPFPSSDMLQTEDSSSSSVSKNFNPADFEGDTSSPFDNMELKTINELEELNSVFQTLNPSQTCSNNDAQPGDFTNSASNPSAGAYSVPTPNDNSSFGYPNQNLSQNNISNCSVTSQFSYPDNNVSNGTAYPSEITRYSPVFVNYDSLSTKNAIRNSKSASDLTKLDSESSKRLDSRIKELNNIERPKSAELHNPAKNAVNIVTESNDSLLDINLTEDQLRIVDHFCGMGFPRLRAARAILILGNDDKKVIDWLCQVQKFSEMGFVDADIEDGMQAHDSDEQKVEEFLKKLDQLKDFGFEKARIKAALVSCGNDRDKALDMLLS